VSESDALQVFEDDDVGYLDWISAHPDGFVVSANRPPTAGYVVLHRAICRTVAGDPTNGRAWTADYLKACSGDRASIVR